MGGQYQIYPSSLMLLAFLISRTTAVTQFHCNTEHCLNQQVEYQCTVTGSGVLILTWKIRNNTSEITVDVYTSTNLRDSVTVSGDFSVQQLTQNPLISNISFTVQSSINGYTILCEGQGGDNKNCTINIADPPSPPTDLMLSFSQTTILISWTQPTFSSQCVSIANYTVNSNITNTDITTTTTSVDLPLAGLSPTTTYCVSVAAVDTANRTGTYSDEECFVLHVPPQPSLMNQSFSRPSDNSAIIRISWTFVQTDRPLLTAVYLSYTVNGEVTLVQLPPTQNEFDIENVLRDTNYLVIVYGENAVGNGSASSLTIIINSNEVLPSPPTTTTSYTTSTSYMTLTTFTPSTTPDTPPSDDPDTSALSCSTPLAVSITLTLILTAVITTITSSIVTLLLTRRYYKQGAEYAKESQPALYEEPVLTSVMTVANNPAYGHVNVTTDTNNSNNK